MRIFIIGGGRCLYGLLDVIPEDAILIMSHEQFDERFGTLSLGDMVSKKWCVYAIDAINRVEFERCGFEFNRDLVFSISAPWIFGADLIDSFSIPPLNLHMSNLPSSRGGAVFTWKILNDDRIGGVSIHVIERGIDSGAVLFSKEFVFGFSCHTPVDYFDKSLEVAREICEAFFSTLSSRNNENNFSLATSIQCSGGTYFPRVKTGVSGKINWYCPAWAIARLINAYSEPYLGAYTYFMGEKVFLKRAVMHRADGGFSSESAGLVYRKVDEVLFVACGEYAVVIESVVDSSGREVSIPLGKRFEG